MTFAELLEKAGHIPIPPYLEREAVETDENELPDRLFPHRWIGGCSYSRCTLQTRY
jgi:hypothetical protein